MKETTRTKKTRDLIKYDLPLISMISCILLMLVTVAVIKFWHPPLSSAIESFIFLVGLIFATLASISAHMRFRDKFVTMIVVIGLLLVLFIGGDIVTPKEVAETFGEIAK